ncbi:MAG: LytTR family DNA-binding domain-containing protein [Lachnospiraceae bacterium]|nr:LytTR family DNA-binding domain-containing protein [Lachnospiraceae bacterium]
MKIAVYSSDLEWNAYMESCFRMCEEVMVPMEVDFLNSEGTFWNQVAGNRYDLVIVYGEPRLRVSRGNFLNSMEQLWGELTREETKHVWQFGRKTVALGEHEIYYIDSLKKAVSVYTAREGYRIRTSMKQEEEAFPKERFSRIHRNCLVNLEHVQHMGGDYLVMKNGVRLDISARRKKQVKEQLLCFQRKAKSRCGRIQEAEAERNAF